MLSRNLEEVNKILLEGGVKRILLDNFDYENTRKAVEIIGNKCQTESSGGITEKTIIKYAYLRGKLYFCGFTHIL